MSSLKIPDPWTIFPLLPIVRGPDGSVSCQCQAGAACGQKGKHPAIKWREEELPAGTKSGIPEGYGIGLATGARSGVVVLDLDYKVPSEDYPNGLNGLETLAALCGEAGIPQTLTVATPSGGFHLYFRHPGWRVKNSVGEFGKGHGLHPDNSGIDIRGDGGMVVLPPSVHKSGGVYEFLGLPEGADPMDYVADLPDWIKGRLAPAPGGAKGAPFPVPPPPALALGEDGAAVTTEDGWRVIDRATAALAKAPDGRRNQMLFRICAEIGDWSHVGEINLDDARTAFAALFTREGWGDPEKTMDTMERGFKKGREKERILVVVGPDHQECNNQAIRGLALRDDVYVVGNSLARDTGGNGIAAMGVDNLQEILSVAVDWRTRSKEGELKRGHPPPWAVREIFYRGFWEGLRIVEGFSDVPVLRPDGSLATTGGYDPATRVVLRESMAVEAMTVEEARALLDDVFADFPFADPSHRASLMCALLTPLAVHAFSGPIPLFLFEASTAGSGKSLLASVVALIGSGVIPTVSMFTPDDAEMRKRITSLAQKPRAVTLLDNVAKGVKLGGPALCAILTSPDRVWSDRLLGSNTVFEGKLSTVFFATSNNTELSEDMHRRVCPVRLVPGVDRPENRTGFRHPNLMDYVRDHRVLFTSAALTCLQEYVAAGMPQVAAAEESMAWGSFEGWNRLVVGCVAWLGYGTPRAAVEALQAAGAGDWEDGVELVEGLGELLEAHPHPEGLTVQEIYDLIYPRNGIMGAPSKGGARLRNLVDNKFPKGPTSRLVGYLLRDFRDRTFNGKTVRLGRLVNGYRRWVLE